MAKTKWKRTEKMQDGCEISANIPALLLDQAIRSSTTTKSRGMGGTITYSPLPSEPIPIHFNIIETPECKCRAERETVDHYLLNCESYNEERDELRWRLEIEGMR